MNTQGWLTQAQVAEMLGVTVETLRRWRSSGIGPAACRFGPRLLRYDPAEVRRWVESRASA